MTQPLEPPRLLLDENADPLVRQLLHSTRDDGPGAQRLLLAPIAIAAMLGTQTLTQAAAASAVVTSAKVPLASAAASAAAANGITAGATTAAAGVTAAAGAGTATGSIGAAVSASLTSSLAALPALTKSLLIGLSVGGVVVATVPDRAPLHHVASSIAVQYAEQVRSTSLSAENVVDHSPPTPGDSLTQNAPADNSEVLPSVEPVPANASRPSRAHTTREVLRRDEASSLELAPPDISREVALLDAARFALGRNDPARALVELERYQALSRRTLDPEATVLRVRALVASGRPQEAETIARAFARRAPNAPQAQLLRKLAGIEDLVDPN